MEEQGTHSHVHTKTEETMSILLGDHHSLTQRWRESNRKRSAGKWCRDADTKPSTLATFTHWTCWLVIPPPTTIPKNSMWKLKTGNFRGCSLQILQSELEERIELFNFSEVPDDKVSHFQMSLAVCACNNCLYQLVQHTMGVPASRPILTGCETWSGADLWFLDSE